MIFQNTFYHKLLCTGLRLLPLIYLVGFNPHCVSKKDTTQPPLLSCLRLFSSAHWLAVTFSKQMMLSSYPSNQGYKQEHGVLEAEGVRPRGRQTETWKEVVEKIWQLHKDDAMDRSKWRKLVWMEWRPAGWSVCLPLLIFPFTVKSKSSVLALAHPIGPGKRAVKRLRWWRLLVSNCRRLT